MSNKGKIDLNIKEEYEKLVEETSNKAGDEIHPATSANDKGLPYEGTFSLKDTAKMMVDPNHKVRFVAEYIQLKIRYEKLKAMLTKWEAFDEVTKHVDGIPSYQERLTNWLGFLPFGSYQLLRRQQSEMGELLHTLEVRAVLEGIDLTKVVIVL